MARRNGLWRACEPLRQGADICPQPRTDAAYGLARRQRERLATVWPEAWMGAEVVRPAAPWVPIRMAAINTGSGQHGKGEAVEFFILRCPFVLRGLFCFQIGPDANLHTHPPCLES